MLDFQRHLERHGRSSAMQDHEEGHMRNPRKAVVLLFAALAALATLGIDSTVAAAGSGRQVVVSGGHLCGTPTTPDCPLN
jgi:hypothetical protein